MMRVRNRVLGVGVILISGVLQCLYALNQYSIGEPTDEQQLMLELINRARADAMAEAQRLVQIARTDPDVKDVVDYYSINLAEMVKQFSTLEQHIPPLSMNRLLSNAARLHSQDMFNNVFQSHISSDDPLPPNEPGDEFWMRIEHQGYERGWSSENIYAHAKSILNGHVGFEIDWGESPEGKILHGMQDPPGHRENIHSDKFKEAGIGIVKGFNDAGYEDVGPMIITQNFAAPKDDNLCFITGVAYHDLNGNRFYDIGEGLPGIKFSAPSAGHFAVTSRSGGYSIPTWWNGLYAVTMDSSLTGHKLFWVPISNNQNEKLDYIFIGNLVMSGFGNIIGENIRHPNGNIFNQALMTGEHLQVKADLEEITRVSFQDENGDIVQVELSGAGSLRIILGNNTYRPPVYPLRYNQAIKYVVGKPEIFIEHAEASTFLSIFTVGKINAVNQALFPVGQAYDAQADIKLVKVLNSTGFGGMQLANVLFSGNTGEVGINAEGVPITVRLTVGDIDAKSNAIPFLLFGKESFTSKINNSGLTIAGGDLLQSNGKLIRAIPEVNRLSSSNNIKSDGTEIPAKTIRGSFGYIGRIPQSLGGNPHSFIRPKQPE